MRRQAAPVGEADRLALLVGQAAHRGAREPALRRACERGLGRVRAGEPRAGLLLEALLDPFARPGPAPEIERAAAGEQPQVGAERPAPLVEARAAPDALEDLLDDVLGERRVAQDAVRRAVHLRGVVGVDRLEGRFALSSWRKCTQPVAFPA